MSAATMNSTRPFTPGVYCPLTTPFVRDTEEIDFNALETQVLRLAKARVGIVLLGTNGEASHLTHQERAAVISRSRAALSSNGFDHIPILAGTGTGSARETITLCAEAKEAGADYVIVVAPGYFSFAINNGKGDGKENVKQFFTKVMNSSPLPVMIYNFPGAAGGIDLDSDLLCELSEHQNCFGAKLTCAGIGKGARLASYTSSDVYKSRHPSPFLVLPGFADYLLPALVCGHHGCIVGTANIIPKTIVKLYTAGVTAIDGGSKEDWIEARELQNIVAAADWEVVKAGIGGTKWAMDTFVQEGLGGVPRVPLLGPGEGVKTMLVTAGGGLNKALELEKTL